MPWLSYARNIPWSCTNPGRRPFDFGCRDETGGRLRDVWELIEWPVGSPLLWDHHRGAGVLRSIDVLRHLQRLLATRALIGLLGWTMKTSRRDLRRLRERSRGRRSHHTHQPRGEHDRLTHLGPPRSSDDSVPRPA